MNALTDTARGVNITDFGAVCDGKTDNAPAFSEAVAALKGCRYGTIYVPDGVFGVGSPVSIPQGVSLQLAPSGKIKALDDFDGRAVLIKGDGDAPETKTWEHHDYGGQIAGGIIDANHHEIHGIVVTWGCRYSIHDLEVHHARAGGIHLGEQGWYEATLHNVRIALALDGSRPSLPGAVGLRVQRSSDSHISQVLVIGYETGVHAIASSCAFHQVHVWAGANRPFKCGFHAAGWNDMYSQCHCDAFDGTAFYVNAPFQRFIGNFCQTHDHFSQPEGLVGFEIGPRGTHCAYLGNLHHAREEVPIAHAFKGSMQGATVLGNLYTPHVRGGHENRIPSNTGGNSWLPPLTIDGTAPCIGDASPAPPRDEEGRPGELRWCEQHGEAALFLRTGTGWKRVRLEDDA